VGRGHFSRTNFSVRAVSDFAEVSAKVIGRPRRLSACVASAGALRASPLLSEKFRPQPMTTDPDTSAIRQRLKELRRELRDCGATSCGCAGRQTGGHGGEDPRARRDARHVVNRGLPIGPRNARRSVKRLECFSFTLDAVVVPL
jgi:hypothetical protein